MISLDFKKVIKQIIFSKHNLIKFSSKKKKGLILRFDVDISINNALEIAKYLKKKDLYGNFFFQPNNEIYNIFNKKNRYIINQINSMGHLTGLHIDSNFFSDKEKNIIKILEFFKLNNYKLSKVVSFHRPAKKVLFKKYKNIINTYDKIYFGKNVYISDSAKNKFFSKNLKKILLSNEDKIQILMHPIWWTKVKNTKQIVKELNKNNENDLKEYLLDNFSKVFSNKIKKPIYKNKL